MLKRQSLAGCVAFSLALAPLFVSVRAQSVGNPSLRAANVARMAAEKLNGGVGVYRPAPCMHEQAGGSCLVQTTGEGFLFRFPGGQPGWKQRDQPPTVETEILVSPDGRSVRQVVYNGPPRDAGNPAP